MTSLAPGAAGAGALACGTRLATCAGRCGERTIRVSAEARLKPAAAGSGAATGRGVGAGATAATVTGVSARAAGARGAAAATRGCGPSGRTTVAESRMRGPDAGALTGASSSSSSWATRAATAIVLATVL